MKIGHLCGSKTLLEKALKQKIPLAIARLHAFHPTLSSYLADLWMAIRTRPALWVAEQKPLDLRYQSDEIWDRQRQLSAYDRLTHVTAESAARYTDDIAELLREGLLDLSVAEDRNKAHQLLQRCQEMWTLAAQKQALTPQEQELVYEVNQALRRLGDD